MKALVLAGGVGSRLRPITHTSAKQLVPVANKPVLFYGLESIAAAGIEDVALVVGDTAAEIRGAVGDGSRFGLRVSYIPQERPLGLAHAVLIARDFLGNDDFVMYLGDNFIVGGINALVDGFREDRPDAQIMLTPVDDPSSFGVVELGSDGQVVRLEEKPEFPKSNLALVGVYLFTPAVHEAVRAISPSGRGELEITDAVQWLVDAGRDVRSVEISGYWKDTGNVADMLEVNRTVLESVAPRLEGEVDDASEIVGAVRIAPGARVRRSRIVGPVVIDTGTEVADSYVGPYTSVAQDCRISGSELEFSIVLRGARIEGTRRVQASLIGRDARVVSAPRVPDTHRLVLGDHSSVELAP
ncbi:glucose-1-phosphate thymidylyltransferase [Streptomyces griseoruber]|uniref:Glucose-1-phosphate thymidylyltransferase n=1 Tax=Streptomyces griseoruber TaxID=1943 RepID=A0A101T267_9ACTN|nr:glucose-1-phosphate thymidylyltransferase [Streptomyces griseoruber]KUN84422.1 glucose-1-phosphate thymidylyltransferase [Streptomyces griseoruber]